MLRNISSAFKARGHTYEMPKSGRPRTVDPRTIRGIIKKTITRHSGVTTNLIATDLNVSLKSIQIIVEMSWNSRVTGFVDDSSTGINPNKIDV